ncbi:g-protein coupled receptor GRL101 [Nephila pilipes]|uniref:G-protein coupled receptor GRL101 n=1 Tax=Nephila pilipes TaxID=299642 RepID=A0A8X6ITH1_NEPPI|nr:g-protein coupled receptor GRL101 [Nephila pilipes]
MSDVPISMELKEVLSYTGLTSKYIMSLFLLLISLSAILSSVWACPSEESIAPACLCKEFGEGGMLMCKNISSAEDLRPLITAAEPYDMFALTIMQSVLLHIPSALFKNSKYRKIGFLRTQLLSLSESDLAFEGLEDRLEELRATAARYSAHWDWSQLKNHRRLKLIDIDLVEMHALDQEFPPLKSLKLLGISRAEIAVIHPNAFSGLENLEILYLRGNWIAKMSRSMLPNPAKKLATIDLSGNLLNTLPKDMFEGMPNLMEVNLSYNTFTTLRKESFLWPFEHLQALMLTGNELRCDCRMKWIIQTRKPLYFTANCTAPQVLKGLGLSYLTNKVLKFCDSRETLPLNTTMRE